MKLREGIRFDWYAIADADFIAELVETVIDTMNTGRSTRGLTPEQAATRSIEEQLISQHLLSALYSAHSAISASSEPKSISVPRRKGAFAKDSQVPNKVNYSWRFFDNVYKALVDLRWIEVSLGNEYTGYTRVYAAGHLAKIFDYVGRLWLKQAPNDKSNLIVLKDRIEVTPTTTGKTSRKKKYTKYLIPTPNTPDVHQMAQNLFYYNDVLTKHCVSFNLTDGQILKIAREMSDPKDKTMRNIIDFSRVQLRRIFSRGDMSLHGRFYGSWWQSIPGIYRQHITIDGNQTCEVDFSSVSLRIIYAAKGIQIDSNVDLYDIGLPNWSGSDDPRRGHIKKYINAMMNAEGGNFRLSKTSLDDIGLSHKEFKAKVLEHHSDIADKLVEGIGLSTTLVDSRIAERVMLTTLANDILVLPIHDSFIVRVGMEQWLTAVMLEAFMDITGSVGSVKVEGTRGPKDFGLTKDQFKAKCLRFEDDPSLSIVSSDDFRDSIGVVDDSQSYLGHWIQWSLDEPSLWLPCSQHKDIKGYLSSPVAKHPDNLLQGR